MEKVNFNFDQLILAGGGPPGPIGPQGLAGPAGPKGDPGNKWYVGITATESEIGTTLYQGDLFLSEANSPNGPTGQVWEWNELANIFDDTGLNLTGPTGAQGNSGDQICRQGSASRGPCGASCGENCGDAQGGSSRGGKRGREGGRV